MSEFLVAKFLDEMAGLKRLGDTLNKFQALLDACSEHLSGKKAEFTLLTLSKNSPVDFTLAPKSASQVVDKAVSFIAQTVEDINKGKQPQCPEKLLKVFLVGSRFELGYGEIKVQTSDLFESNLRGLLSKKRREFQVVRGRVVAIDIHDKREFRIFPRLAKPVKCQFEPHQFDEVRDAIGKIAEVSGVALIWKGDPSPTVIKVDSIKVVERRPAPPRSLRGLGARDYAGIDSVAHVRAIREEFEQGFGGG
ncbi:hypothetical protein JST97_25560 [bacterium]|nr:hypothetical protein [bacterium]